MTSALLAAILETEVVAKMIAGAFAAGVGATAIFGVLIYGATRFDDLRREGRGTLATLFVALSLAAGVGFVAAIALGLYVIIDK